MSYVLGLNLSHDRSAAIVRDGETLVAIEEERLDRIKHSEGFLIQGHFERLTKTIPMKAITYCLDAVGIGIDDLDLVVGNRPLGDGAVWRIARELPIRDKSKIHAIPLPSHHLAHAATTFYTSSFEESAVLVVDQAGSRFRDSSTIEKHTAFVGEGTELRPVAAVRYPVDYSDLSLGLFYDFFTVKLNFLTRYGTTDFGVFDCGGYPEAGKTMGLAPYGRPRPEWGDWLTYDGFDIRVSQEELEGIWKELLSTDGADYDPRARDSWRHPFAEDVAYKVQEELERAMLHLASVTKELTGKSSLCLAGGVTLNSVVNQKIRSQGPFDDVFIPAPAGDSGVAVGAALYGWHTMLGGKERRPLRTAALGRTYSRKRVESALERYRDTLEWREAEIPEVADLLAGHHLVGWVQGPSEMGPRALGHRSMLADPRHPQVRDYLNTTVKHREVFRPYAPSVLAERVSEWFDFTGESPFMLLVPEVLEQCRAAVPAITHVDGTARVQTVHADLDPAYHALISAFHERTGVPMLLNTSYNDNGEPIVETPEDALRTFARTELDFLYLEGLLVSKKGRNTLPEGHPALTPLTTENPAS